MKFKRILRRSIIAGLAMAVLYFSAAALAVRNYWAGLFWGTYLYRLPLYDIIQGPQWSLRTRSQYAAATKFIRDRCLTPSTARFCPYQEARFGILTNGRDAMEGWVDMQNVYGAMIRSRFWAEFDPDDRRTVLQVQWMGETKNIWYR